MHDSMPSTGTNLLAEEQWYWWCNCVKRKLCTMQVFVPSGLHNSLLLLFLKWSKLVKGRLQKPPKRWYFSDMHFNVRCANWMNFVCRTHCIWQSAQDGSVNSTLKPLVSTQDHIKFCTTWVKFSSETLSYPYLMLKHPLDCLTISS